MVNAVTDPLPNVGNRLSDAILRAEIEVDCDGAVGRFRGSIAIKPHDGVASGKPAYHRGTDEAARSCHEDNFAVVAPWLMLFDSLGHQILYDRATRGKTYRPIGRAHVSTPVTNVHLVGSLLLEKKNTTHNNS